MNSEEITYEVICDKPKIIYQKNYKALNQICFYMQIDEEIIEFLNPIIAIFKIKYK